MLSVTYHVTHKKFITMYSRPVEINAGGFTYPLLHNAMSISAGIFTSDRRM